MYAIPDKQLYKIYINSEAIASEIYLRYMQLSVDSKQMYICFLDSEQYLIVLQYFTFLCVNK